MSHNQVTEVVRLQAETQMEPGHIGGSTADIQGNEIVLHSVDSSANRGDNAYSEEITYAHCIWSAEYSDPDTRQEEMFRRLQSEVLENVSQGYNSCILSYKQTGSGKSFTLMGTDGQPGLIPGICSSLLNKDLYKPKTFQVEVSYMDIWNDEVADLLQPSGDMMAPSDDQILGSNVMGVSQYAVSDFEDITFLMGYGADNECPSNRGSRQSHTIFTITVTVTDSHPTSESRGLLSKVILVDLADDETAFNPGQHKITPENHPTLESVVYYLTEKSKQKINWKCMPYQDCLLTRILQESLGGDCNTMLLAIITPTVNNYTCGTLRLNVTGKEIRNRQVVNKKMNTVHGQKRKLEKQMQWLEQRHKEMYCPWDKKLKKTETAIQDRQKAQINPTTDHSESAQIAGPERHSGAGSSEMEVEADSSDGKGHIDLARQHFQRNLGILFWDNHTDIQWLTRRISKAGSEGSCLPLCVSTHNEWMSVAGKSSLLILYHSMKSDKSLDELFSTYFESLLCEHDDQSTHTRGDSMSTSIQGTLSTNSKGEAPRSNPGCLCMTSFGVPRTVIFVIVDVKDSESEMRSRWDQAQFSKCELLLFTEEEITYISSSERPQWTNIQRMEDKLKQMCRVIRTGSSSKFTIGIFSRCGRDHYTWLLRSEVLSSHGQDIRPFYISHSNSSKFREEVSRCTFGILYHTKKHGRVNITDVEDALYTEELEYLHDKLGKKNVLVLLDDLEDSSETTKERILQRQPSIRRLAEEQIIISEGEKTDYETYRTSLQKVDQTKVQKKLNKLDILIKGECKEKVKATLRNIR
ncbi:uncharacterized protein O3C94_018927 [Discoglossus pictus]